VIKLVLASSSKQRKDILDMIGIPYEVVVSNIKEESDKSTPYEYVMDLSHQKANAIIPLVPNNSIIIAADSVIYMNGKIYEKPKTKLEAFNNLKEMSGKTTYAYTGITIKDLNQDKEIVFYDMCEVTFNNITDEDISWYVDNEENALKRCGYVILGKASLFLNKVNGDYNTLFGLSPSKVYDKLKELGYTLKDFEGDKK
jgi:septum formation protein